jgi:DNA-binding NarL/FixJ family response regulator
VVAQAGDSEELLRATGALQPDLAIVDIRMPPTRTDEGVVAAEHILGTHQRTAVLVLSQDWQPHYAARLRSARSAGVGYLLKERVGDVRDFARALREVADGGQMFEQDEAGED